MKAIIRGLVVAVVAAAVGFGTAALSDPDGGASIGAGVFAILAVLGVAFVWALLDARQDAAGRVLVRWAVVGVLVGLVLAVLPQVGDSAAFSVQTYVEDLPSSFPVGFVLTVAAAGVGTLLGALSRRGRRSADEGRTDPV